MSKREENLELEVEWRVAMRPGQRRKLAPDSDAARWEKAKPQSTEEMKVAVY